MRTVRTRLRAGCAVLASALVLAGCGTSAGGDSGGGDSAGGSEQTRTVEHAMGTSEVPEEPERVVVLDTGELDDTLALGVKPVGAVHIDVSTDFLGYLGDQTEGIEKVGTISEPNLEKIAALEPDLILSSTVRHEDLYPQLTKIAPTVLAPDLGDTWKENFKLYAEALGRSDKAETMLADYEKRAAALGKKAGQTSTVGIVRFLPGQIRLYSDQSFAGTILQDAGLQVPEPARGEDTFLELSPEQVTKADADVMFTSTYGPPEETGRSKVLGGQLWQTLPAVKQDRVHSLDDDLLSGIGIQAAQEILAVLEKRLS